jgi:hypothetical protein
MATAYDLDDLHARQRLHLRRYSTNHNTILGVELRFQVLPLPPPTWAAADPLDLRVPTAHPHPSPN